MRSCPLCKTTYPEGVEICRVDGTSLDKRGLERTASISAFEAPPASFDSGMMSGIASDSELTRRGRPPRSQNGNSQNGSRPGASGSGGVVAQTAEMEKDEDFSVMLSAADSPQRPATEKPESRIGEVLGSYRLAEVIGRGGMGCVYRAEHIKLGRDVALKLLREDYAERRDAVARFFQEARAVNLIRHRNIVDVIDYVELDGGAVFIIMELLAGHSLARLMRAPGGIPLTRALGMVSQICDGLSAAHSVGIVHRDLKPDNIIVSRTSDGSDLVKILDFGVAKLIDKHVTDPDLTAAGSVIGTPAYMSPEQAGGLSVDQRSDVYSLGAIMYEIFTRKPMFRANSFGEYVRLHLTVTPRPPREVAVGVDVDPRLEEIILRCLSKSPNARFQSAEDLRAEVTALLGTLDTQPPGPFGAAGSQPSWQSGSQMRRPTSGDSSPVLALGSEPPPVDTPWGAGSSTPYPNNNLANGTPSPYLPGQSDGFSLDPSARAPALGKRKGGTALLFVLGVATAAGLAFAIPWIARGGGGGGDNEASAAAVEDPVAAVQASPVIIPPANEDPPPPMPVPPPAAEEKPIAAEKPAEVKPPAAKTGRATPPVKTDREKDKEKPRPPVLVRIASSPSGSVYESGKKGALCETPCAITIQQRDGDAPRRVYVVKRKGYKDETVAIDLADPPRQVRVTLEREAKPPAPSKPREKKDKGAKVDGETTFNPFNEPK
jgi:serine/threonine protein kinase